MREKVEEQEHLIEVISNLKRDIQEIQKQIDENLVILQHYESIEDLKEQYQRLMPYLEKYGADISNENIAKVKQELLQEILGQINAKAKLL